jgi:hypothetical protein
MAKTKDINISINSIEKSAVSLLRAMQEKKKLIEKSNPEVIQEVKDYIFGKSEDNPYSDITSEYNNNLEKLREKVQNTAKIEKTNYLGKNKKGVNYIKKIQINPED